MKKTLTEQYRLIKEDKGHKGVFLKEAKKQFPNLIRQGATYNEASTILKQKNIISENFVGLGAINSPFGVKEKEGYENAFENFLKEAAEVKAEEKKVSKEVEEDQSRGYDTADKKDPNNMIFGQIQMGYYCELKNPKNADKTEQEIKDIVFKNLEKDPIFYTKNGQFGEEGIGYTDEAVSLGIPKEPKGPHKSSGYGTLKENKILNESIDFPEMEDEFEGAMDAMVVSPEVYLQDIIDASPEEIVSDDYYEIMNAVEQGDYSNEEAVELAKSWAKYKLSTLSENTSLNEHSISTVGGIVTGTGFVGMNYMDYFGLNEDDAKNAADRQKELDDIAKKKEEIAGIEMFKEDDTEWDGVGRTSSPSEAPEHMEAVADAVEMAYEAGMSTSEIIEFVEMHLGLKMGDY
jgi:hypothetical protein